MKICQAFLTDFQSCDLRTIQRERSTWCWRSGCRCL